MPFSHLQSRYSRWDGTQEISPLSADDLMRAMSDDLMHDGDLNRALQRLFRWGFERPDGEQVPGLREMLQRLKDHRQEQLNRYDLGSVLDDVTERLRQIVELERGTIQRRLDETAGPASEDGAASSPSNEHATSTDPSSAADRAESGSQPTNPRQVAPDPADAGGSQPPSSSATTAGGGEGEPATAPDPALRQMLARIAAKRLEQLDALPDDPGGTIRALNDYEFMDHEARQQFQDLLAMLQQQVLQSTFQGMQQALSEMTPEDVAEMRQMMADLNEMLEARQRGEDPNFDQFMHKWGHFFGPDIKNLDDLLAHMQQRMNAMQQLMQSMDAEQRGQLEGMMQAALQDQGLQAEMSRLGQNLGQIMPADDWRNQYQFGGDESLTLAEAMRMMDRLREYDTLEEQLRDVHDWNDLAALDDDTLRDLLGEEDQEQIRQLQQLTKLLQDAGYIRKTQRGYELTPRGVRKIGEKALTDIFQDLKRDRVGQHDLDRFGGAGERTDVSKAYEFGDPFLLDLPKTVMNAVQRGGSGSPVQLDPRDFEVYRTEYSTRSATVLMVDMSRSMLYNGCFHAAKKVALALDSLIRGKYPRDHLSIIGFSYMAQEIKAAELPSLDWNEYNYGTNMQHGFQLARQILGREKGSNRQIIVITDGEPTAHFEQGQVRFSYPPTPRTFQETLREVVRCTRDGITINTFMLERSPYMVQFINDLMRINGGRVFVATPDRLGEYLLVDYVANKRKWIG
ncbi:MAG: VWA domain-containing protein [Chloroflexota bacterium]|nr:VWA domain-containing protein [Chloroflexota bacterium]